MPIHRGRSS